MSERKGANLARDNTRLDKISRRRFEKDQMIFREHEVGDLAFIIAEGEVEILKEGSEGMTSLRILIKGAMFG